MSTAEHQTTVDEIDELLVTDLEKRERRRQTRRALRQGITALLVGAAISVGLVLAISPAVEATQERAAAQPRIAQARIEQAVVVSQAEDVFFAEQADIVRDAEHDAYQAAVSEARTHAADRVDELQALADNTAGEVSDDGVHVALVDALETATDDASTGYPSQLRQLVEDLDVLAADVQASQDTWTAEQEAARAAQKAADKEAVEQNRVAYSTNVWTTGTQPQIDACKGGVSWDHARGRPWINEHRHCGADGLLDVGVGERVELTGMHAGTYELVDSMTAHISQNAPAADGLRGDILMQVCHRDFASTGDMRIAGLIRIGD